MWKLPIWHNLKALTCFWGQSMNAIKTSLFCTSDPYYCSTLNNSMLFKMLLSTYAKQIFLYIKFARAIWGNRKQCMYLSVTILCFSGNCNKLYLLFLMFLLSELNKTPPSLTHTLLNIHFTSVVLLSVSVLLFYKIVSNKNNE